MLGRLYIGIGICAKYIYDNKINGFSRREKIDFVKKKLLTITRNTKSSILLSGLASFFNSGESPLTFESKNALRQFIIVGNMKMNGSKKDIEEQLKNLVLIDLLKEIEIVVAPPSLYLEFSKNKAPKHISLAAQNCYKVRNGNYTGEISPVMLKDIGIRWVILGHSERRQIFREKNALISDKINHCLSEGMNVVACVGETLEDRENGKSEEVIFCQMKSICEAVFDWTKVVIAYEPVWASAEKKSITPKEAQEAHFKIRNWLKKNQSPTVAQITRIIYAGPVSEKNCVGFAQMRDVDGFLLNETSLEPEFLNIIDEVTSF